MLDDWLLWLLAIVLLWLGPALAVGAHALLTKREGVSILAWFFGSLVFPGFGPWFYAVLGVNRIERRARRTLGVRDRAFPAHGIDEIGAPPAAVIGHLDALRRVSERVTSMPMVAGNRIEPLYGGEEAYPPMLAAIRGARRSVTLLSYIFDWDEVGKEFTGALADAARRGVKVHVLLDGLGAQGGLSKMGRALLDAGAEVASFFPMRFPLGRLRANLRNHRKILVVDGDLGFTGGMNISKRHLLRRRDPGASEDVHFRVRGPVVSELQHVFEDDWILATERTLEGEAYYPDLLPAGDVWCRAVASGPDQDLRKIDRIMRGALEAARHEVRIVTPYFIPTGPIMSHLAMASLRGVRVMVMVPAQPDHRMVRWASDALLPGLVGYGVDIRWRRPPLLHAKLMIVDDRWTFLGSANVDPRSLRLNFEFNLEAWSTELAAQLATVFDERFRDAERATPAYFASLGLKMRLRNGVGKLLAPML